jgi:alpha-D-ribose 1-methylphosphonate 5-triphosphate synthase subunit PhnG
LLGERLFCFEREEPIWGREGNAGRSFGEGEMTVEMGVVALFFRGRTTAFVGWERGTW